MFLQQNQPSIEIFSKEEIESSTNDIQDSSEQKVFIKSNSLAIEQVAGKNYKIGLMSGSALGMCSGLVASLVILASLKIFPTFALVSFGSLSGGLTGLLIGLVINFSNLKERLDLCDHSRLLALFYKREVDLKLQNTYLILLVLLIVCFVLSFSLHPDANWLEDFSLPLSFAIIYLIFGILLGTYGLGLIQLRNHEIFNAELLEKLTEFVVIVSVFSCGLKIVRPLRFKSWQITTRLIVLLMPISIFALAIAGKFFLAMNWGAAILLGAILAPTDPVLASEVQLTDLNDEDELRFALTSEGG